MQKNFTLNNSIQQVYSRIIILTFLAHILLTAIFTSLSMRPLVIYNIFSCFFYAGVYYLTKKNYFRTTVVATHLEICLFVIVSCYYLGWELGFSLYLIALTALVYFCPFKRNYVPYLFSFIEIIIFLLIKAYTLHYSPILICNANTITLFYFFNSIASFTAILYAAFISRVSAVLKEQTLTEENSLLDELVNHDALTHLWSRRHLINQFETVIHTDIPVTIVMTDVDNFKHINDTYGHDCGDYILSELATLLRSINSPDAGICRWGGEEFILMFHQSNIDAVIRLVENIRATVSGYAFQYRGQPLHITMTFGISTSMEADSLDELVRIADKRMYYGKQSGKNTVITANLMLPED